MICIHLINVSFDLIRHETYRYTLWLLFSFLFKAIKLETKERIIFPFQKSSFLGASSSFALAWWTCTASCSITARPGQSSQSRRNDIIWHIFEMTLKADCVQGFIVSQRTHVVGIVLKMRLAIKRKRLKYRTNNSEKTCSTLNFLDCIISCLISANRASRTAIRVTAFQASWER